MNLNSNSSYLAIMPSNVIGTAVAKTPEMAISPQIVDSTITTITSDEQQQHQSIAKYSTSIKSSPPQSPSSPQPLPSLLHQLPLPSSSLVPSAASSSSISSATTLSSGGYHSNLISRISNSMNSSSNNTSNSTFKDKVQISCNLSQDMEATGSKNNNNLSNETSVSNINLNLNNSNINNNNNLNLIDGNTAMLVHDSDRNIIIDGTASSIQMSSFAKTSMAEGSPSKIGSSSPLHFLRLPTVYSGEMGNAMVGCLNEDALNLTNIGKGEMTMKTAPLTSSGIVQSRVVTAASTSIRHDESSDLMRRGNFGRN